MVLGLLSIYQGVCMDYGLFGKGQKDTSQLRAYAESVSVSREGVLSTFVMAGVKR